MSWPVASQHMETYPIYPFSFGILNFRSLSNTNCIGLNFLLNVLIKKYSYEKSEETKGLIRIRKSNKERQDNSQMKRDNKTNNGRQNNTQKRKHLVTQTLLKQGLNSDAPEGLKVPVLLGVLQIRLQVMNDELLDDKQQSINLLSAFDFRLEFATSIFL